MKSKHLETAAEEAKALRTSLAPSYLAAKQIERSMRALREQVDQLNQQARDKKSESQTKPLPPPES